MLCHTHCFSLRCWRFLLNAFLTRNNRNAARSTESVVELFLAAGGGAGGGGEIPPPVERPGVAVGDDEAVVAVV